MTILSCAQLLLPSKVAEGRQKSILDTFKSRLAPALKVKDIPKINGKRFVGFSSAIDATDCCDEEVPSSTTRAIIWKKKKKCKATFRLKEQNTLLQSVIAKTTKNKAKKNIRKSTVALPMKGMPTPTLKTAVRKVHTVNKSPPVQKSKRKTTKRGMSWASRRTTNQTKKMTATSRLQAAAKKVKVFSLIPKPKKAKKAKRGKSTMRRVVAASPRPLRFASILQKSFAEEEDIQTGEIAMSPTIDENYVDEDVGEKDDVDYYDDGHSNAAGSITAELAALSFGTTTIPFVERRASRLRIQAVLESSSSDDDDVVKDENEEKTQKDCEGF